jgi:hypothetical protein
LAPARSLSRQLAMLTARPQRQLPTPTYGALVGCEWTGDDVERHVTGSEQSRAEHVGWPEIRRQRATA